MTAFRKAATTALSAATLGLLAAAVPAAWGAARPEDGKAGRPAATRPTAPKRDPKAVAAAIDRIIDDRLASAGLTPSPQADDAEFLRRLSLDLRGRIPTAAQAAAFLRDESTDKRARLVDAMLADPAYGEHFANVWYHRIVKPDDNNRGALAGNTLIDWLEDRFNANEGWDRTVTALLTARGSREENPATTFWLATVGDFKLGQPEPNRATAVASRLFLGVRLECCECHNHPFTSLKQTDFWGVAAFFAQTRARNATKGASKNERVPEVFEGGGAGLTKKERRALGDAKPAPVGSIAIPFSKNQVVKATFPGGGSPDLAGKPTLRPAFAAWLTAPDNPYFARASVNKLWANFFGRGLVDPIDDMQPGAKVTHPELLALLADEFAASGFDQKHLARCVVNSRVYQRGGKPLPANKDDDQLYSRMPLKVLSADMLFDSLEVALGRAAVDPARRRGKRKQGDPREQFRTFFHAEADDDIGVVEDYTHGIPQVLRLMNSRLTGDTSGAVADVVKTAGSPDKVIHGLYLRALSRRPNAGEVRRAKTYVSRSPDPAQGYGDLLWALLNSAEFLFNH